MRSTHKIIASLNWYRTPYRFAMEKSINGWLRVTFNTVMSSTGEHWEWVLALLANMEPWGGRGPWHGLNCLGVVVINPGAVADMYCMLYAPSQQGI